MDILRSSELKWTRTGEFNLYDHYICHCGQASLRRNVVAIMVNKRVCEVQYLGGLKSDGMILLYIYMYICLLSNRLFTLY